MPSPEIDRYHKPTLLAQFRTQGKKLVSLPARDAPSSLQKSWKPLSATQQINRSNNTILINNLTSVQKHPTPRRVVPTANLSRLGPSSAQSRNRTVRQIATHAKTVQRILTQPLSRSALTPSQRQDTRIPSANAFQATAKPIKLSLSTCNSKGSLHKD